jgi:hypothetical protein
MGGKVSPMVSGKAERVVSELERSAAILAAQCRLEAGGTPRIRTLPEADKLYEWECDIIALDGQCVQS